MTAITSTSVNTGIVRISRGMNSPVTAAKEKRVSAGMSVMRWMLRVAWTAPSSPSQSSAEKPCRLAFDNPMESKCSNAVFDSFSR